MKDDGSELFTRIMEESIDTKDIEEAIAYFEKQNIKLTESEGDSIRNSKNLSELFSAMFVINFTKEEIDKFTEIL